MPINVTLIPELEQIIREQVRSGGYGDAGEVIAAALRLMQLEDAREIDGQKGLRAAIAAGLASGPGKPANTVFDRLDGKYRR
jgi:antitoxin ParD1/3/4